ncbi:MAG TPA: SAM-dependent methyltransferase [Tenuifilaceae bacterium]|nr:SAM-dependent methyltransferase [Tenuifilaceae bacterium]HPE18189.1 SAM-dependent methyltransferase [Tenuifilaceae bacterium]HPJ46566.1 SAM-dependent methyltransferase [Tenuifilaceae bacterium]HPQ34578.1 SAM-dependent methyltransferase [Tenuifilaceae bacterium]HRX68314.1 SAM-dependent methyltransferase [Tenuifilaceae bacterium]
MQGNLYLIPTTLGGESWKDVIPDFVAEISRSLKFFVVEDVRTARRYLSKLGMPNPIDTLDFQLLNEHTPVEEVEKLLKPIFSGESLGLLSEAGVPAVADPGANLVALAQRKGVKVIPLTGPSSIILALMGSGFNGQNFAFVGYLPVKSPDREKRIRQLEQRAHDEGQTQLFIEAPYRNNQLLKSLLATLNPNTKLCVAADITMPSEFVVTKSVKEWQGNLPDLHKRPTIFAINS